MMLQNIPEDCNYIEIVLFSLKYDDKYITHHQFDEFEKYMSKIKNFKYFQKEFKCYQFENMIFENSVKEQKIFTKDMIGIQEHDNNFIVCTFNKEKKPFHTFPSTMNLHNIYQVNRLTFRIHNRLFLNFESQYHSKNNSVIRKIYFNYNHEKNVEVSCVEILIRKLINILIN